MNQLRRQLYFIIEMALEDDEDYAVQIINGRIHIRNEAGEVSSAQLNDRVELNELQDCVTLKAFSP